MIDYQLFISIKIFSFLLIIEQSLTDIDKVITHILNEANANGVEVDPNQGDLYDIKVLKYLKNKYDDKLEGHGFILKPLDYYYRINPQLGSFESLSTTYTANKGAGVYSVYFSVVGKGWSKGTKSEARTVHDEIVIPE